MFSNAVSANKLGQDLQVLAQHHLDQARLHKEAQQFDMALVLYDHAKVAFKSIADTRQLVPQLSQVKGALSRASTPQTADDEALRQRIAEIYFERAELLKKLGKEHKAQASYKKARDWGYEETEPASISPATMLAVHGTTTFDRAISPTSMQGQQPIASLTHEKSAQVDYLFETALSTLRSLQMTRASLFLIYAHHNPVHGRAEVSTSKYLIEKLSQIQEVVLYSYQTLDQTGKLEDILTSQLCLLPIQLIDEVKPVDKVVVCCSEVLGSYLEWPRYEDFYQKLRKAYLQDSSQGGYSAIRAVTKTFSQEVGFHHVLTEMAFLQIRAEQFYDERGILPVSLTLKSYEHLAHEVGSHHVLTEMAFLQIRAEQVYDEYGILPVLLTPKSYEQCLAHFIPVTTVRTEDIPRFEQQAKAGQEAYANQGRHVVLFKLIERLLVGNNEAKAFLNNFWQGYDNLLSRLNNEPSTLDELQFTKLVDSIFGDIREANRQLASTAQQASKFSSINLREALYQHYQHTNLSIQRLSGESVSLEDCYINLAIIDTHAQREKDQVEQQNLTSAFERLPSREQLQSTNYSKSISLATLFDSQKLRDGSTGFPKRILIQGRAGVGKTTLCKKLVYDYHSNELWRDQFACMLWVPLRLLSTHGGFRNLEDLLKNYYFASQQNSRALVQAFHHYQDKTLFILDGLDEIADEFNKDYRLRNFLNYLLNQAHVMIISRPAGINIKLLGQLDLELEIMGFSPANAQYYIEKFVPASKQVAILQFIHRTPLIQELVNIPIQLDALCYSWDQLPQNQVVTMSMLYEAMVDKLRRKGSLRLEKKDGGKVLGTNVIQIFSKAELEKLMDDETHYLGYVAFKGFNERKIAFNSKELDQRRAEFEDKFSGKELSFSFTDYLNKGSFLHLVDAQQPEAERQYHFPHFTFQEFFAAKFLAWHLQTYTKVEKVPAHVVQKDLGVMPQRDNVEAFIATYKYNPRYEIVWWMVAGLLKGAALENFFHVLNQSPQDLVGIRHQQVMLGCLNEARAQLDKTTIHSLETKLMQCLRFEIKWSEDGWSELSRHKAFPEHLLLAWLGQPAAEKSNIIRTLGARPILSTDAISALANALQDSEWNVRSAATSALGGQATLPAVAFQPLVNALQDTSEVVRWAVVNALGGQAMLPPDALQALISASCDKNEVVREAAVNALNSHAMQSKLALDALINALQDKDASVRSGAASVLEGKILPEAVLNALIRAAQDPDLDVKEAAVRVLGSQETLPEAAIQALIGALQDVNAYVRYTAASTLRSQVKLPEAAFQTLVSALQHRSIPVRFWAAKVLGGQKMLPENILHALLGLLLSSEQSIREAAVSILGEQTTLPEAAIQALVGYLQHEDASVRYWAANTLAGKMLSETVLNALIPALADEVEYVRDAAAKGLRNQKELSSNSQSLIMLLLKHENASVRSKAANALEEKQILPEETLHALIQALKDKNEHVRYAASCALANQATLQENAVKALINALQDENAYVRYSATSGLGRQVTQSEAALQALIDALQNKDDYVRYAASSALSRQTTLPEAVRQALINALQDENASTRSLAAKVLDSQKTLREALIGALPGSEQNIMDFAASVLDSQAIQLEATHQILISALQDENVSIKSWAASALGNQKILPGIALDALINALQDPEWDVRDAAASTLGGQIMLPKATLDALISALQNKHAHIRYVVASALGGHATRSEVALEALIRALEDEDEYVRDAAASALGGKATFSETAIEALISALHDEDEYIRIAAASALGGQASLSRMVLQALIDALQDDNPSVRSAIMQVLKLNLHQLYRMLPTLDVKQIQTVYKQFLFGYGCAHIAPLYIQDNKLHFYTETGLEQPILLTSEQSTRVIQSFRTAQVEEGIEDIPFVDKLQQDLEQAHVAKADNFSSGEALSSISDLTYTETGLEQPIPLTVEQSTEVIQSFRTARVKVGIEDTLLASKLQPDLEQAHAAKADNSSSDEARIRDLTTSMSRFSLGQLPRLSNYYAPSETSDQLLKLLKDQPSNQPNALIEVVGKAGAGKTTMLQHLIDQNQEFFASYKLFGRIDCSSVSRAHADIQAISYTASRKDLKPQAALREVASYIKKNSPSLLILDGLSSGNVDFVFLDWLKSSFKSAQLIYLTAESLADSLGEKLERTVKSLSLGLFTPEQAKQLAEQCLPKEPKKSLEKIDFAKVIEMTGGFPAAITTLCQHYKSKQAMFNDFADFLAQPNEHQNALVSSLNAVAQASFKSVEEDANPVAARALNIIKQAAWLGNHPIPFAFFVHEQQTDGDAIQMLRDKELAILDINRGSKTLKLNSIFLHAVQDHYKVEQSDVLKKNIQRLSEVFNYLTTNEGKNGSQSKPKDLTNYTDLVHTLLFETCKKESFAGDLDLLQQVLALGSSLARMYYMYHGESELAYKHLQNAEHFAKQGLSDERIEQFAQNPEKFKDQEIEPKEAALLRLYAQEYLYQSATIASQLDKRGEVPAEVVQNFEKSYAIQVNLGEEKDPESIAYTLRNYTRALRKQGHLLNTLEEFRKLRKLLDRYPEVFNDRLCAELLIDEGIVQKEAEDAKPEGERKDYQAALNTFLEMYRIYLEDGAASNQHQALGILSIYLGETYVAAGQFAEGVTHTCRILHYDGKNKGRQARAYFNLAQAFDKAGYVALAKLFIERAAPLQLTTYKATTDRLQLNIDKKLLERYQHAESLSNAQTANWKSIEELTTYCETELVSGSKPSNSLSLAQIKAFDDKAYNWLRQHDAKVEHAAQQAELAKKGADLDAQDKADAENMGCRVDKPKFGTASWHTELNWMR